MLCYRDITFCGAACAHADCLRQFTEAERQRAERWWGGPGAPVAFADFSARCPDYAPTSKSVDGARTQPLNNQEKAGED